MDLKPSTKIIITSMTKARFTHSHDAFTNAKNLHS